MSDELRARRSFKEEEGRFKHLLDAIRQNDAAVSKVMAEHTTFVTSLLTQDEVHRAVAFFVMLLADGEKNLGSIMMGFTLGLQFARREYDAPTT